MQNEKTSNISECLNIDVPSGSSDSSNSYIVVTRAEISVDNVKHNQNAEKGDYITQNGNSLQTDDVCVVQLSDPGEISETKLKPCSLLCNSYSHVSDEVASVIEVLPASPKHQDKISKDYLNKKFCIRNTTLQREMSKQIGLRRGPGKHNFVSGTTVLNKLAYRKLKNKPAFSRINGLMKCVEKRKAGRPRKCKLREVSDASQSDSVSSGSEAVITTPSLPGIVLASDPFTFIPGQLCTPQVAFPPPVFAAARSLSPVQEVGGIESLENLTVDSDSEVSNAEDPVEEVENPVILFSDAKDKNVDGYCSRNVSDGFQNNNSLSVGTATSPGKTVKKRRKRIKLTQVKKPKSSASNDERDDLDNISTSVGSVDQDRVNEKSNVIVLEPSPRKSMKNDLEPSPGKSMKRHLQPSPNKSTNKQTVQLGEPSLELCHGDITATSTPFRQSLNIPNETIPGSDSATLNVSAVHSLAPSESEDVKYTVPCVDPHSSNELTGYVGAGAVTNSVCKLPIDDSGVSAVKVVGNDSVSLSMTAADLKAIRYQKQVVALQKARDARWKKFQMRKNQGRKTFLDSSDVGVFSTSTLPNIRRHLRNKASHPTHSEQFQSEQLSPSDQPDVGKQIKVVHKMCQQLPKKLRKKRKKLRFYPQKKKKTNMDKQLNECLPTLEGAIQKPVPTERSKKSCKQLLGLKNESPTNNPNVNEDVPVISFHARRGRKRSNSLKDTNTRTTNSLSIAINKKRSSTLVQMNKAVPAKRGRKPYKHLMNRKFNCVAGVEHGFTSSVCGSVNKSFENMVGTSTTDANNFVQDESIGLQQDTTMFPQKRRHSFPENFINTVDFNVKSRKSRIKQAFAHDLLDQEAQSNNLGLLTENNYDLVDTPQMLTSARTRNNFVHSERTSNSSLYLSQDQSTRGGPFSPSSEFVCPSVSGNSEWSSSIDDIGQDSVSSVSSPKKGGMGSSIGGVISQLFDDITTKPGNGFVVNIRLDVERKNSLGQGDSDVPAPTPVNNSRCGASCDCNLNKSKSDSNSTIAGDINSYSNLELCSLLEERLIALTNFHQDVRSNLLDNIRHVKHVLRKGV